MLSINTNISSLIAQNSLKNSTSILNQAVERMTTGYKINHASDNAANYSISTNMQTQISSYDVAADNVAMGMDLITTASDIIANMQNKASRLQALSIQARNGTYGAQSMASINSEAAAIMAEINRLYSTAEYNNISLFNRKAYEIDPSLPQAGASGFIDETGFISTTAIGIEEGEVVGTTTKAPKAKSEYNGFIEDPKTYTDAEVAAMTTMTQAVAESSLVSGGKYSISSVDELVALAEYVNAGNDTTGMIFVLGANIDLSSISNWTPIGNNLTDSVFKGTFDGNGHVIKNLTIDSTSGYQGLFGRITNGEIKNIGLKNSNIKGGHRIGILVANLSNATISNSYATGNVTGSNNYVGGLVGYVYNSSSVTNSYATGDVSGAGGYVGGLVGCSTSSSSSISNSFATGNVNGSSDVGGLVGYSSYSISNSYATGAVSGTSSVGGLVGFSSSDSSISNSYATGNVTGSNDYVGGLVGYSYSSSSISNSYATGNVTGSNDYVGGLVGYVYNSSSVTNSYATGAVGGQSRVGGLVGYSYSSSSISNSYATGNVTGSNDYVGGLVGYSSYSSSISNSYATGNVTSSGNSVGGLVGCSSNITSSYATGNVTGSNYVGGLTGDGVRITNSYATGTVNGNNNIGGLAGYSDIINNGYATGAVNGITTVGGLVGQGNEIENSYATGLVNGTDSVGGLAGKVDSSDIINCYAIGHVNGVLSVGGLVGTGKNICIYDSYAKGNVTADSQAGGLIGEFIGNGEILSSYSTSDISADEYAGGLVGIVDTPFERSTYLEIYNSVQYGKVSSYSDTAGNFVGGYVSYEDWDGQNADLYIEACQTVYSLEKNVGADITKEYNPNANYDPDASSYTEADFDISYVIENTDIDYWDAEIIAVALKNIMTSLQVGVNTDSSNQIKFDTNFEFDLSALNGDIASDQSYAMINEFMTLLSEKSTMLGAVENRLQSAIESIEVNLENLTSSLSTIRDADIAEVSSEYIRQQILQQASATLMATANQSPSIALQLI